MPAVVKAGLTGAELRAIRSRLGISMETMAREIGVTLGAVQRWEAGHRSMSEVTAAGILATLRARGHAVPDVSTVLDRSRAVSAAPAPETPESTPVPKRKRRAVDRG